MKELIGFSRWVAALLALTIATASTVFAADQDSQDPRLEIIVPAYFYPGTGDQNWPALTEAARRTPITAIINPGSGPGAAPDSNYQAAANTFKAAGGNLIGYVHTSYTNRPIADVTADMERFMAWYPIDGFFIDEMSNQDDPSHLTYYQNIYNYAKNLSTTSGQAFRVIGNPGTNTSVSYFNLPTADALLIYEGTKRNYKNFFIPDWLSSQPEQHIGHLVYQTRNARAMRNTIRKAVRRHAGLIYVTNDQFPNPWDSLPSYWEQEVDCVIAINNGAKRC